MSIEAETIAQKAAERPPVKPDGDRLLLTVPEVAWLLNVDVAAIEGFCRNHAGRGLWLTFQGKRRFTREQVQEIVKFCQKRT